MKIHFHPWENGHPVKSGAGKNAKNKAFPLTPEMKKLLVIIKKKVPYAN
mgnify:FL=1